MTAFQASPTEKTSMDEAQELRLLFHQLNNQLGIILSHAELLEAKAANDLSRSRAGLVVASVLDAMSTVKELRFRTVLHGRAGSAVPTSIEAARRAISKT